MVPDKGLEPLRIAPAVFEATVSTISTNPAVFAIDFHDTWPIMAWHPLPMQVCSPDDAQQDECGARGWDRTSDTRIFNPVLYQLSYQRIYLILVPNERLELSRLATPEPKSGASTNSANWALLIHINSWCLGRDSNSQVFRHWNLNPARLPISPPRHYQNHGGNSEIRTHDTKDLQSPPFGRSGMSPCNMVEKEGFQPQTLRLISGQISLGKCVTDAHPRLRFAASP